MDNRDSLAIAVVALVLAALSAWLRFDVLEPEDGDVAAVREDPDYYDYRIENFVSTVVDRDGRKHRLIADRLFHYPSGDRARLENPHLVQYRSGAATRHVYADSGWLYNNRSTVTLTGNVRVVQDAAGGGGFSATSRSMTLQLKEDNG